MSIEAYWYQCYSPDGTPPRTRRLSRQPMDRQWAAAIDLAIAFSESKAGYRPVGRTTYGETTWLWPQPEGQWWLIPHRVEARVFALERAAVRSEISRGNGCAESAAITARLRAWKHTGHWRSIAAPIHPRHGNPGSFAPPPRKGRRKKQPIA